MNSNPSENGGFQSIQIDSELFGELRRFCNRQDIRFKDFVEDALERAIYEDQSIDALCGEIQDLKQKLSVYERSFLRGFNKGFWFAFLATQGQIFIGVGDEDFQLVKDKSPKITTGIQLSLFS